MEGMWQEKRDCSVVRGDRVWEVVEEVALGQ